MAPNLYYPLGAWRPQHAVLRPFLTGKEHTYAGSSSVPAHPVLHPGMPVYAGVFPRQPPTPDPCLIPSELEGHPDHTGLFLCVVTLTWELSLPLGEGTERMPPVIGSED